MKKNNLSITTKYALFGFAFGLCFPLGGWAFECIINNHVFDFEGIKSIHLSTPVHFIIDSAPLVLGCAACWMGKIQQRSVEAQLLTQKELNKANELSFREQLNTKRITEFSIFVSTGNLDFDVDIYEDNDELGNSLQSIQKSLFEASEKDKIDRWKTEGLTQFLQILRNKQNNIEDLSVTLISALAKFLKSYYASIYLTEEDNDNTVLKLNAAYAGKGLKEVGQTIEIGEGLIGQTYKSKKSTLLQNLPEGYAKINSGLGKATPTCLFLTPLVHNGQVTGVLELASFKVFTKIETEFIEKLSENIASTIIAAKVNTRNNILLERSQKLGDELRTSEESMRQQIEEMRATQEELDRQNKSTSTKLASIETIVGEIKWTNSNEISNPEIFEK